MAGLMLLTSLFVLALEGGEGSESAEALDAARTFYEQNAEVKVSARNRHLLGRNFVDVVSHAYELQKDEGAGPIFFSERMQQRTQRKFETLADDAFAGICDCSAVSAEQLALIRLLLIFLDERDQLAALYDAVKAQGQYTTLLQALEAVPLDREEWKQFAEHNIRAYSRSSDQSA
jgi:hypothetical protein